MKKIICILFALILIAVLSIPAYAATPKFSIPKLPEIPEIKPSFEIKISESFLSDWFTKHPFKIDFYNLNFSF